MIIGPTTNFLRTKSAQSMFFRLTSNKNQRSKILTFHICVEIPVKLVRDLPKNYLKKNAKVSLNIYIYIWVRSHPSKKKKKTKVM